jgi:small acid-soluble spore protein H (minor)
MDSLRAKQILESHGVIGVTFQDAPVWIEQITNDDTAQVTVLDTNERLEVPVTQLQEGNVM